MNVKDLSKEDRPRERLIKVGPRALSDVELLAILIGSGTKTSTVLELATEILKQYTLVDLKDLTYEKINKIKGIKQAKACQLLVCFEIARRSSQIPKYRGSLETAKDIYEYIYDEIYLESSEIILAILCDCKLHPIKKIVIRGDEAHQVNFPTKKIITHALNIKAYAIILVHNHPSGDIHPSKIDIKATLDFQQLLNTLDILLLEHLVVSPSAYFSMHEHGLLSMDGEYSIMGDCFEKFFCKMSLLLLVVLCYVFIEPVNQFFNTEINTMAITNFLAENLYKNDESVANVDLVVKDYVLEGECLYIFPLSQEVALPIDMMIVEVFDGGVEVVNLDSRFRISRIKNRSKNLYQYVHGMNPFATTDDFFIVEGDNLSMISLRLQIYYEKV